MESPSCTLVTVPVKEVAVRPGVVLLQLNNTTLKAKKTAVLIALLLQLIRHTRVVSMFKIPVTV
jgi:hypothetical protein